MYQAISNSNNSWDNGYPSGGNFWDDYTGMDNDGDGIGDIPYNISGGDNKDYYPLMEPWIKDKLTVDSFGPYYGLINEPLEFYGFAVNGNKPYTWYWDFGDGNTSNMQNPTFTYSDAGNYSVNLTVIDNSSNSASDITSSWIQEINIPPKSPLITGPNIGKYGASYTFMFSAIDPDGNPVSFYIDWGDDTKDWTREYASGDNVRIEHAWYEIDIYTIKARAKDVYGDESNWSEFEIKISIPRTRAWLRFFLICFQYCREYIIIFYRKRLLINTFLI